MICAYGYCIVSLGAAFADAATQDGRCVGNICFTEWAMSNTYGIFIYTVSVAAGSASMIIYVAAVVAMIVRIKQCQVVCCGAN